MKIFGKKTNKSKHHTFAKMIRDEEKRMVEAIQRVTPGTKEHHDLIRDLNELRGIRKDDRPSAGNIISAATSLGGLGMAIGYDSRHNLPRAASAFINRPKGV